MQQTLQQPDAGCIAPQRVAEAGPKKSLLMHARIAGASALRLLVPWMAIPGYCSSCMSRMQLVLDSRLEPLALYEDVDYNETLVRGIRFWGCPRCGQSRCERYAFITDTYPHKEH